MCITLPAKVLSVTGQTAVVEIAGVRREIFLAFEGVNPGDWLLTYAGAALSVIDEEHASEMLTLLMPVEFGT